MVRAQLSGDGPIAQLALSGPLDAALVQALADACDTVAHSDTGADAGAAQGARVLLLTADAAVWKGWPAGAPPALAGDPFGPLAALPQPTVAALEGDVLGAGLELALCVDIRVAGTGSRFALLDPAAPEFPIAGGLQRLSRAIGRSRALELSLAAGPIDAATALHWGLVSAVLEGPQAEAQRRAGQIAARGPIATRLAKEAVRQGVELPLEQALRYETDLTVLLQATNDRAEGVRAFIEKRPPRFHGS